MDQERAEPGMEQTMPASSPGQNAPEQPRETGRPETARGRVLGQLIVCEGCCCGQESKGRAPVPSAELKRAWKEKKVVPP